MVYLLVISVAAEYRNDIKPGWGVEELLFCQVTLCSSTYLSLLSSINCRGRRTKIQTGPCFNLNKNQNRFIPGDDIYFTEFAAIVFDEYFIANFFQISGDSFLTAFSETLPAIQHIP